MKLIAHIFLLLLISSTLYAQDAKVVKARSLVQAGKTSKAITLLYKAYTKSGDRSQALELIRIHSGLKDHQKAMNVATSLGLDKSTEVNDAEIFTDLLIASGKYSAALEYCLSFIMEQEDASALYDRAYACENLLKAEKNAIRYKLLEVPFNTWADEISIANYRKHYVMSSNRVNEAADGTSSEDYFDLFMLKQDFGKWRYPFFLLQERNSKINRTTLSYSADGNRVIYTLSNYLSAKARKKAPEQDPVFSLHEGISMGDEWVKTRPLPFMKEGFSYKDAALHPGGKLLVFSSNVSGFGGFDLFSSEWKEGEWAEPVNLGKDINSAYHETMAYFDEDGNLLFSSSNPLGFGGYDIYRTENDGGRWLRPEILPPPINSEYDDLSFIRHYGRTGGYIVSNRPGGKGGYDIYEFAEFNYKLGITVLDASNGSILEMAEIELVRDGIKLEQRMTNSDGIAEFSIGKNVKYEVSVVKEGYLDGSETFSTAGAEEGKLLFANVRLDPDPDFKPVSTENEQLFNNQNFILFTAFVTDASGEPLPGLQVRLINTSSNRMKLVNTDEEGSFRQSLFLGNEYRFVIDHEGKRTEETFSTNDLAGSSPIEVTFVIGGE